MTTSHPETTNTKCLEIAVYQVNSTFDELQRAAHQNLEAFDGFVASVPCAADSGKLRCDLVLWDSHQAALAAGEAVQKDERFAPFMNAISEIEHLAHYHAPSGTLEMIGSRAFVELAAYETRPDVPMQTLQGGVHDVLKTNGATPIAAHMVGEPNTLLDVVGWKSPEDQKSASESIPASHPELAPFFSGIKNMIVFKLFTALK